MTSTKNISRNEALSRHMRAFSSAAKNLYRVERGATNRGPGDDQEAPCDYAIADASRDLCATIIASDASPEVLAEQVRRVLVDILDTGAYGTHPSVIAAVQAAHMAYQEAMKMGGDQGLVFHLACSVCGTTNLGPGDVCGECNSGDSASDREPHTTKAVTRAMNIPLPAFGHWMHAHLRAHVRIDADLTRLLIIWQRPDLVGAIGEAIAKRSRASLVSFAGHAARIIESLRLCANSTEPVDVPSIVEAGGDFLSNIEDEARKVLARDHGIRIQ